jgi:predicted ATPase
MPRNTYVIGAQCTGKTTLVNALECHFKSTNSTPPFIIKEVARTVLQKHQFTAADIRDSPERALQLQKLILAAQHEAEIQHKNNEFISDRSGLDPVVYARTFVGEGAAREMMESNAWKDIEQNMRSARILVCEPGGAWLRDDGVRLMPIDVDEWNSLHLSFCESLQELDIGFTVVPKEMTDIDERVRLALS